MKSRSTVLKKTISCGLIIASLAIGASVQAVTPKSPAWGYDSTGDRIMPMPPVSDITPNLSGSVDFSWVPITTPNSWSLNTNWTPTAAVGGPDAAGLWVVVNTNIGAATTINLFNTGDAGDLTKTIGRLDIGDTNSSSSFTIAAGSGSGVLDFNGDGANAQLNNLSTSGAANTISAPVTLSTSLDFTNASASALTISGAISGAGGLNVSSGTLVLTNGSNTYSGVSTLSGGQLRIDSDSEPGTGQLNLSGGTLVVTASGRSASTDPVTNNIVLTANSTIDTTSAASTVDVNFSGTVTGTGGTLTITNTGADAVTDNLSVRFSGGNFTMARPIALIGGNGRVTLNDFGAAGTTHTYDGVISGDGSFNRSSSGGVAGTSVFTAANTYTGTTTINNSTLQLGNGGATGSLSTSSTINGLSSGTFKINRSDAVAQGTAFSGSAITGSLKIEQAGAGSTTLNIANTFSGGVIVSGGTLIATANGALGSGSVSLTASGVNLTLQGAINDAVSDNASISLVDGSTVALNQTGGSDSIAGLTLGSLGIQTAPGTYGSTASGADHPFDAFFTGTGTLTLVPEPATYMLLGVGLLICAQRLRRKRA